MTHIPRKGTVKITEFNPDYDNYVCAQLIRDNDGVVADIRLDFQTDGENERNIKVTMTTVDLYAASALLATVRDQTDNYFGYGEEMSDTLEIEY
jgi:hypothetical protein